MNRKSYWSIPALIVPALIFSTLTFLTSCSSSSSTTTTPPPPTVSITATSGTPQSAAVGAAFTNPLVATVTTGGTPTSGVTVTFTAPTTGASGTFATTTPGATDAETTNASGVATSKGFTANMTAGAYTVTAAATGATATASFALTNTAGTAANLTATSGTPQNVVVSATAVSLVAQVTDGDGNGVMGVSVTFTAPSSGASGLFTGSGTNAETDMTDVNGNATAADFVANATTGGPYNVVATSGTLTPVNFSLTNIVPPLGTGNYVFFLTGEDSTDSFYSVAGVFSVSGTGTITGGEQDFVDLGLEGHDTIASCNNCILETPDGNVQITLNTGDANIGVNGTGVEILDASMVSTSNGLLTEYDTWASGSGTLDLQTSTAAPSGGYAFFTAGLDGFEQPAPVAIGGVINVTSAGNISGAGSVFDQNDGGILSSDQLFAASTVTSPSLDGMGMVTFTLTPQTTSTTVFEFALVGYIVDASHIRLVETADSFNGTTGGTALGQGSNTGTFSNSSLSGSSGVFGAVGADVNGPLQAAGLLTFNVDGSVSGNLSFNDFVAMSPQGGTALAAEGTTPCTSGTAPTACYAVDNTGRVTITNVTDNTTGATFNYNLQLYLAEDGGTVISMDTGAVPNGPDVLSGLGYGQTGAGTFNANSFNGNYTLSVTQQDTDSTSAFEYDGIGTVLADGTSTSLTGFLDLNGILGTPLTPTPGIAGGVTGTFAANANGVFTGTITGIDTVDAATPDLFTFYLIGGTGPASVGVIGIENDAKEQLTLGTFELQQ